MQAHVPAPFPHWYTPYKPKVAQSPSTRKPSARKKRGDYEGAGAPPPGIQLPPAGTLLLHDAPGGSLTLPKA